MPGPIFEHIDAMLDPAALGAIVGFPVTAVDREPIDTEGFSDNSFERITCRATGGRMSRLILKRFDRADWIARLTQDDRPREIALLDAGWYRTLPAQCQAPMVAAASGTSENAMLMTDASSALFPPGDDLIEEDQLEACLTGAAALHAEYWGSDPQIGATALCTPADWIGLLTPEVGRRRHEMGVDNDVTASLEAGWQLFTERTPAVASRMVAALQDDATVLLDALDQSARTLIHGDLKLANLGVDTSGRLVMLDWALASRWSPSVDLGWFLAVNSARLPAPKESIIERYRIRLAGHGVDFGSEWQRQVDLGLLAGGVLRLGWAKALGTTAEDEAVRARETAELDWWGEAAERATRWLG